MTASRLGFTTWDLISVVLEGVLFAINTLLCIYNIAVLVKQGRNKGRPNWVLLISSACIYLLGTGHISISIYSAIVAPQISGDITHPLSRTYRVVIAVGAVLADFTGFTADLILIWRLYVLVNHYVYLIIIPVLLQFITLATALASAFLVLDPSPQVANAIKFLSVSSLVVFFINQIVVTGFIIFKMVRVSKRVKAIHPSPYFTAVTTIIESALPYTIGITISAALFYAKSNTSYGVLRITDQLAVMYPLLVVARAGLGLQHNLFGTPAGVSTEKETKYCLDIERHPEDQPFTIPRVPIPGQFEEPLEGLEEDGTGIQLKTQPPRWFVVPYAVPD